MKKLNILIVEDNLLIAENISQVLSLAGYNVIASPASGEEALLIAKEKMPDVVLMDIHLAGQIDGIQTTEKLNAQMDLPVIYLTDFDDNLTMNRAKHTHPAAYLLKPFKERDLLNAIELAFFNASSGKEAVPGNAEFTAESSYYLNDRIFVKKKDTLQRVDIKDILWIEADRSYFKIITTTDSIMLVGNLKEFENKLVHPLLLRVHRSFIVNMDKVTGIMGNMLQVQKDGKTENIQFSSSYKDEIFRRLKTL
jgi:DNA-binding LytR/AlgR family response regulator